MEGSNKSAKDPNYFEQIEHRINTLNERIQCISRVVGNCVDRLDGAAPSSDNPTKGADIPDTIFGKIGIALCSLEQATNDLAHQQERLSDIFG